MNKEQQEAITKALWNWGVKLELQDNHKLNFQMHFKTFNDVIDTSRGLIDAVQVIGDYLKSDAFYSNPHSVGKALTSIAFMHNNLINYGISEALDGILHLEQQ